MEPPSRIRTNRFTLRRDGKPLKSVSVKTKEKQKRLMKIAAKKRLQSSRRKAVVKKRKLASRGRRNFTYRLQGSGYAPPVWVDVDFSGRRHRKSLYSSSKNSVRGIKQGRRSVGMRKCDPLKRKGGKSWKQNGKFGSYSTDFRLVP